MLVPQRQFEMSQQAETLHIPKKGNELKLVKTRYFFRGTAKETTETEFGCAVEAENLEEATDLAMQGQLLKEYLVTKRTVVAREIENIEELKNAA